MIVVGLSVCIHNVLVWSFWLSRNNYRKMCKHKNSSWPQIGCTTKKYSNNTKNFTISIKKNSNNAKNFSISARRISNKAKNFWIPTKIANNWEILSNPTKKISNKTKTLSITTKKISRFRFLRIRRKRYLKFGWRDDKLMFTQIIWIIWMQL